MKALHRDRARIYDACCRQRYWLLPCLSILASLPPAHAGRVDFQLNFEAGSAWDGNYSAQAAMESMFGQFEFVMRTSGNWDSTIEVYVTDNEYNAYASSSPGSSGLVQHQAKEFIAPNAWQQIVGGIDDPNGAIQPDGSGRDIVVHWNLALSQPQSNIGLLRHELMHGLGMTSHLWEPSINSQGVIVKPRVGQHSTATVLDAALYDLNGAPLLSGYGGSYSQHVLADYAVDTDWNDANESGIVFRGINDDGSPRDMTMNSGGSVEEKGGGVDFSHITEVSYAYARGWEWDVVNAADRAFLRGLGYQVVSPTTRLADYSRDTAVDGRDFLEWQRQFGAAGQNRADGNSNNLVDATDLAIWQNDQGSQDDHGHLPSLATALMAPSATGGLIAYPGDIDWFAFEADSVSSYRFSTYGGSISNPSWQLYAPDGETPLTFSGQWQPNEAGTYFLRVAGASATAMGSYGLSIEEIPPDDHANSATNATAVEVPSVTSGLIGGSGDQDWFSFAAVGGQSYVLETTLGTLQDTFLALYGTNGMTQLTYNDDFNPFDYASQISWIAPSTGTYFARVTGYQSQTGSYSLSISSAAGIRVVPEPNLISFSTIVLLFQLLSTRVGMVTGHGHPT
jgi:hypothetical protein